MSDFLNTTIQRLDKTSKGSGFENTVKFVIKDEGSIMVDGTGAREGDEAADLTIKTSAKTFQGLLDGNVNPATAFMMGKIKVEGDMTLAMKLGSLLG